MFPKPIYGNSIGTDYIVSDVFGKSLVDKSYHDEFRLWNPLKMLVRQDLMMMMMMMMMMMIVGRLDLASVRENKQEIYLLFHTSSPQFNQHFFDQSLEIILPSQEFL